MARASGGANNMQPLSWWGQMEKNQDHYIQLLIPAAKIIAMQNRSLKYSTMNISGKLPENSRR